VRENLKKIKKTLDSGQVSKVKGLNNARKEIIKGTADILLIEVLKMLDLEEVRELSPKDKMVVGKRLAEIRTSVEDKTPDNAIQINNNFISEEEALKYAENRGL